MQTARQPDNMRREDCTQQTAGEKLAQPEKVSHTRMERLAFLEGRVREVTQLK